MGWQSLISRMLLLAFDWFFVELCLHAKPYQVTCNWKRHEHELFHLLNANTVFALLQCFHYQACPVSSSSCGQRACLRSANTLAEVVMFTAGLEDYACPIADRLQSQYGAFKHRLYRPATVTSPTYPCIKDLSRLGRDLKRTVLVDDTPLAFLNQPDNGVPILGFRCGWLRKTPCHDSSSAYLSYSGLHCHDHHADHLSHS